VRVDPELYPWLSAFFLIWGLLDCFFGYRIFRITIIFWGAVLGGFLGIAASGALESNPAAIWIGLGVGALVGGALAFFLYLVMVFLAGLSFGIMTGVVLLQEQAAWIAWGSGLALGLLCGWLALKLQRVALILITALAGALRAVVAAMYFTHQIDWNYYLTQHPEQLPALWDAHPWLAPVVIGVATLGALAQFGVEDDPAPADRTNGSGKKRK
jgi:hypothetical protein